MYYHYLSNFGRPPIPDDLSNDSASVLEKTIFKGFHIYGHGGHLSQQTVTILAIFCSPDIMRLYLNLNKIGS